MQAKLSGMNSYHIKKQEDEKMSKIPYNHKAIEKKWREKWEENPVNVQYDENGNKKEKY